MAVVKSRQKPPADPPNWVDFFSSDSFSQKYEFWEKVQLLWIKITELSSTNESPGTPSPVGNFTTKAVSRENQHSDSTLTYTKLPEDHPYYMGEETRQFYRDNKPPFTLKKRKRTSRSVIIPTKDGRRPDHPTRAQIVSRDWDSDSVVWTLDINSDRYIVKSFPGGSLGGASYRRWKGPFKEFEDRSIALSESSKEEQRWEESVDLPSDEEGRTKSPTRHSDSSLFLPSSSSMRGPERTTPKAAGKSRQKMIETAKQTQTKLMFKLNKDVDAVASKHAVNKSPQSYQAYVEDSDNSEPARQVRKANPSTELDVPTGRAKAAHSNAYQSRSWDGQEGTGDIFRTSDGHQSSVPGRVQNTWPENGNEQTSASGRVSDYIPPQDRERDLDKDRHMPSVPAKRKHGNGSPYEVRDPSDTLDSPYTRHLATKATSTERILTATPQPHDARFDTASMPPPRSGKVSWQDKVNKTVLRIWLGNPDDLDDYEVERLRSCLTTPDFFACITSACGVSEEHIEKVVVVFGWMQEGAIGRKLRMKRDDGQRLGLLLKEVNDAPVWGSYQGEDVACCTLDVHIQLRFVTRLLHLFSVVCHNSNSVFREMRGVEERYASSVR